MVIKILKKINEKEACSLLMKEEQVLSIINIDEIKESTRKENQYYFYVDYEMEDGVQFGVSYFFF